MTQSNIFQEELLKYLRFPKHSGSIENPDLKSSVFNPICGDELELTMKIFDGRIQDCKIKVRGCSICQISSSIMTEIILFKTLKEVLNVCKIFIESLKNDKYEIPENLEKLRPLISLKKYKSRIKCMKLAWDALDDCMSQKEI